MILQADAPNVNAVWIALITAVSMSIVTPLLQWFLSRKGTSAVLKDNADQHTKLGEIKVLVNGRLQALIEENESLRIRLAVQEPTGKPPEAVK